MLYTQQFVLWDSSCGPASEKEKRKEMRQEEKKDEIETGFSREPADFRIDLVS